jgi:hypothetical protein
MPAQVPAILASCESGPPKQCLAVVVKKLLWALWIKVSFYGGGFFWQGQHGHFFHVDAQSKKLGGHYYSKM